MSQANVRATYTRVAAPKRVAELYSRRWDLFPYLLAVLVLFTCVSLFHVWSRIRLVELSLQVGEAARACREQQQENSRLRVEVASLQHPARIEAIAKGELGMALPTEQQVVTVR